VIGPGIGVVDPQRQAVSLRRLASSDRMRALGAAIQKRTSPSCGCLARHSPRQSDWLEEVRQRGIDQCPEAVGVERTDPTGTPPGATPLTAKSALTDSVEFSPRCGVSDAEGQFTSGGSLRFWRGLLTASVGRRSSVPAEVRAGAGAGVNGTARSTQRPKSFSHLRSAGTPLPGAA
jgi:hypothetical protein